MDLREFDSLIDLTNYFNSEQKCLDYLAEARWAGCVVCPHCGATHIYKFSDNKRYKCAECKSIFNAKVGTVFENTKISLQKWFIAMYMFMTRLRRGFLHFSYIDS